MAAGVEPVVLGGRACCAVSAPVRRAPVGVVRPDELPARLGDGRDMRPAPPGSAGEDVVRDMTPAADITLDVDDDVGAA